MLELVERQRELVGGRHLVVPGHVVAHERDRVALVGVGDHERGLAGPERHRGQHVEQLAVIMAVDLDDARTRTRPPCRSSGSRSLVSLVVAPCCSRLRSTITVSRSSSYWEAAIIASQLLPSCSSPSPVST